MAGDKVSRSRQKEIESFVERLRGFYGSLDEIDRDMLETIFESSQGGPQRYHRKYGHYADNEAGWNDLARWLAEADELLGWSTGSEGENSYYYRRRR